MRTALLMSLAMALAACERTRPAPAQTASSSTVAAPAASKVEKIVFIDKEQACDCTRKRIEDTWAAMQAALGTGGGLPVERIYVDTQAAKAETYTLVRPLMVLPGIYFVDQHDAVIELLEGEVTKEQIVAALKARLKPGGGS